MKYRAPEGVTALFCAGETIAPDEAGVFEASEDLADELKAHGCVAYDSDPFGMPGIEKPSRARSRTGKVN